MYDRQPQEGEWHERLSAADSAYLAAHNGDMSLAESLPVVDRQIIFASARCGGIKEAKRQWLPGPGDVADQLDDNNGEVSMPALHMAAEYLSGLKRPSDRAAMITAQTGEVLIPLVPETILGFVSRAAARKSHQTTARVAGVASEIVSRPGALAMWAIGRGSEHLTTKAGDLIRARYDVNFWQQKDLAPWVWANLLERLSDDVESVPPGLLEYASEKYRESYQASHLYAGASLPLIALKNGLEFEGPTENGVRTAVGDFRHHISAARQDTRLRRKESLQVRESTKPSGEKLAELRRSSQHYNELIVIAAVDLAYNFKRCFEEGNPASLAEAWAALVERVHISTSDEFRRHVKSYQELVFEAMAPSVRNFASQIREGTAPVGVVRIAADAFHDEYKGWAVMPATKGLEDGLNSAAFDWYNHPKGVIYRDPEVMQITREAYLSARLNLADCPGPLVVSRARRLASITQPDRRAEEGLCEPVKRSLQKAREVSKPVAKRRWRR